MPKPNLNFFGTILIGLLVTLIPCVAEVATEKEGFSRYVRYSKAPSELSTSIIRYGNKNGQTLDLISAIHVGNPSYYQALNQQFTTYDAVLFELILPDSMVGKPLPAKLKSGAGVSSLQNTLANSLGLVTQIENIDYSVPNFVHADLTQSGLSKSMDTRQENVLSYALKALANTDLSDRDFGVSTEEMAQLDLAALLAGTSSPSDRKILLKMFATALTSSGDILATLENTALIGERNTRAMKVLEEQTSSNKKDFALFYGAAHIPDFEKRLKSNGWEYLETEWIQAWAI